MTSGCLFSGTQNRMLWKKYKRMCVSWAAPLDSCLFLSATVQVLVDGAPVRIQLWDTAGQVSSIKAAVSSGPI